MPDFNQTRSEYLKVMMGERQNAFAPYRPDQMNDVGDTSFDVAALSDEDINNAIKNMTGTQYEGTDVFKALKDEQSSRKDDAEKPWWQQVGDFFQNLGSSIFEGILTVVDEVKDFGLGVAGGLGGGWFGQENDFTDWVANAMTDDSWITYTTDFVDKFSPSYVQMLTHIGDDDFWDNYWSWDKGDIDRKFERRYEGQEGVHKIGNFVGEIIPSVALAVLTSGASVPLGAQAATQAGFGFARGMGGGQSRALSEGATFQQSAGYGAAEGSVNAALDAISVAAGGTLTKTGGSGAVKAIGQKFGKAVGAKFTSGTVQVVADKAVQIGIRSLGSAGTAAVRTAFEPALQMIYDDKAWYNAYGTEENRERYKEIIAKSALTAAAGSAIVNTGRELFGVIRSGGFENYKENYFADLARSEAMGKMTKEQRGEFVKSQREYLDNQRQVMEIQKQVDEMRASGKTDAEVQSFVVSKMRELAPKIEAWTDKYQDFYNKLSYQVGTSLSASQQGMSDAQINSTRNRGANRFAGMIRDLHTNDTLKASLIKLGSSIASRGGDFEFTSDGNGGGQATFGPAVVVYKPDSDSIFYESKENPSLPAVEAKVVQGSAVLEPKNVDEMQTIAFLAKDPTALQSMPTKLILPLRTGNITIGVDELSPEQIAKLATLGRRDFLSKPDGTMIADLGGGKSLAIAKDGVAGRIVPTEQTEKLEWEQPMPRSIESKEAKEKAPAGLDKNGYDLSKPEEVDRFLSDTVAELTEKRNNENMTMEIVSDKPLKQRLKDLKLATEADRLAAKQYLVDYYKNVKISYTDATLDGKKRTYSLTELLSDKERDALVKDIGDAFMELIEKGEPTKYGKTIERFKAAIERYRERVEQLIGERKEANAKAENTRLLSNQIHRLRESYPLRDSSSEANPVATRGNARWAFVHHIHGKKGSYSLSDNFFKSIDDYVSMVEQSDIKDSGYYLQEVRSAALLSKMASILSGVNEVGADGQVTHHSLNSAQERVILDTINEIKKIVKVEKKLDVTNKANAFAAKDGLSQIVDSRGKASALFYKGMAAYGANFLRPDDAFKLMFGANNVINDILGKELNDGFNKAMLEYEKKYNELLETKFKELKLDKNFFKKNFKLRGEDVPAEALMTIYAAAQSKEIAFDRDGNPSLVDGNNLVSLREKGISYVKNKVKHDIYWDDDLLPDVERALPENYKKMVDWAIEFGNTTGTAEYEKMSLVKTKGGDTTNTIQGVYVPKKSDIGRSGFGAAVISAVRDLDYTKSRTGSVNELTSYNVASEYGKQYLNTLITEYIMPVVSKINGVFSAVVDDKGHTLLQLIERDPNLSAWIGKAIDNKVKAVMGISDERFKDNVVMRIYNVLLKNVGALALVGKLGPILKQPVSDLAIPGFSNVEMVALAPLEIKILSDKAKMKAINEHNANTFYGARIRNKKNAYSAAMLNAEDGLRIAQSIGFKPFGWMDKGAIAFGNAYIAAHLQHARPELKFGTDAYWAASDELTANLYNYSVNHIATNMPIVMNSNNPIAKTVSLFQAPNMLMASGVASVIADVETYAKLPSLEELEKTMNASVEAANKAKSDMDEAEKRLNELQEEDEGLDYSSMSKEEKAEQKRKIDDASEEYAEKSNEYAKAKGKAEQDKKNYEFKKKYKPAKSIAHAVSTIIMVSALMVAITELDRHIVGKKDWDDWNAEDLGKSIAQQAAGGWLPGINTLTSLFIQGYDVSASGFDVINDIKDDVRAVVQSWQNGKFDRTMIMPIVDMVSRAFGIPVKNAYDLIYGFIKTFDPATAIKMKDFFYGVSSASLAKTIKSYEAKGDISASSKLMQRYYTLYKTGFIDHETAVELSKLESEGLNPIARSVPDYVQNEDGERVSLTEDQRAGFAKEYSAANEKVSRLVKSERYRKMDSATKAKSIKKIYDLYYEAARYRSLGVDPSSKLGKLLAYASDMDADILETLMLIQQNAELADTKSLTKKEQAVRLVNRQQMSRNQRLLTLYLMGYGVNEKNRKQVRNYLVSIGFTNEQAEKFLPS